MTYILELFKSNEIITYLDNSTNSLFSIEAMLLIVFTLIANRIRVFSTNLYYRAFTNLLGTLFHELAHFLVAIIFLKIPKSISIWPKKEGENYHNYGRVEIKYEDLNIFNQTPISLAPILITPLIVLNESVVNWCALTFGGSLASKLLFAYLMIVLITNSLPSSSDLKSAFFCKSFFLWSFIVFLVFYFDKEIVAFAEQILNIVRSFI